MHPGAWLRRGIETLVIAAVSQLGIPDAHVLLGPLLRRVLRRPLKLLHAPVHVEGDSAERNQQREKALIQDLRSCLLQPLSRRAFRQAVLQQAERRKSGLIDPDVDDDSSDSDPDEDGIP